MNQRIIFLVVALLLACGQVMAQSAAMHRQTIVSSGGRANGNSGTLCYSLGQVTYITPCSSGGSMAEGVHQPYELFVTTGYEVIENGGISIMLSPNPTFDFTMLRVGGGDLSGLHYQLLDMAGHTLLAGVVSQSTSIIPLTACFPSTYILKVFRENIVIKTFKIVKQ